MTTRHLAVYTFGNFIRPSEHPSNQGFHDRNDPNFAAVEVADGFIARSGYDDEPGPESWGEQVYPRFYIEHGDGWAPSTLSLWEDVPSIIAFAYHSGIHAEAMRHGREWFIKPEWPPYALWWVDSGHMPTWAEAIERHEFLHDNGPTAFAFNFKQPFDEKGQPTTIDRDAIKRKAARNAQTLRRIAS
ncbi:DUF3291 domain-containing protein [Rhizobiales bacterium]|uniref:DUF3291 domain-containing protein n=1 Tax=Hongsoonwoonella zoysiae TaxID=2821844 RepID=UPI00155F5D21|nr:DUF3291 domain-containing protein [Hongsoonwoonella zoysiae]NRG18749.1 DUF3291 domain-containing protein [Hongsoonwoonella zoysiae]